jgi:outer membrane protein OmpA-like peptidoglycan-associated protein
MRFTHLCVPLLLIVGSCSSPPKPPTVDESHKRPANAAIAVSLQTCEGDLQSTRIAARESRQAAEASRATAIQLASQQKALAAQATRLEERRNAVYSILFPFGGTHVELSQAEGALLVELARVSPLILLSGRTDGPAETPAESRVARERAEAVRTYLIEAGIAPARIRTTWQPIGDHAAENSSAGGRRLNRRVEVELYRAAPRLASLEADSGL